MTPTRAKDLSHTAVHLAMSRASKLVLGLAYDTEVSGAVGTDLALDLESFTPAERLYIRASMRAALVELAKTLVPRPLS